MQENLQDSANNIVANLKELAELTSDEYGAQRVAWTPIWQKSIDWFSAKANEYGAKVTKDAAGNIWATIEGDNEDALLIGSHLDSVPNGGWLDGALGIVSGLEVLRRYGKAKPVRTIHVVSWADEEGTRFGSSVMGSSAATGRFDVAGIKGREDNDGISVDEALAAYEVDIDNILEAHEQLKQKKIKKCLEFHIEQGPIMQDNKEQVACVYGAQGIERHFINFEGQPAHAGSFPIKMREDAFLAAAECALEFRKIALKYERVCTVGKVSVEPNVATIYPGKCTISLDQRSIDNDKLQAMNQEARAISERIAQKNKVSVKWDKIYTIEATIFDEDLTRICQDAIEEETGQRTTMYSGPLHDAVEMAQIAPTIMMFTSSIDGLSHCKEEDTPEVDLEIASRAFLRLVDKVM